MEKIQVAPNYPTEEDVNIHTINVNFKIESKEIYICKDLDVVASLFVCTHGISSLQLGMRKQDENELIVSPFFAYERVKGISLNTPTREVRFPEDFDFIGIIE